MMRDNLFGGTEMGRGTAPGGSLVIRRPVEGSTEFATGKLTLGVRQVSPEL